MNFELLNVTYIDDKFLQDFDGCTGTRRGANPIDDSTRDVNVFIAAMNTMAEAVRETATATMRAINRLGERDGDRNGRRNGRLRDELMHSLVPLKKWNFAELVNKSQLVKDCEEKMATVRMSHQDLPPMNFNRYIAHRQKNFKVNRTPSYRNQQVGDLPAHGNGERQGRNTDRQPQPALANLVCD
ncbi:hypothetical protein AHAS_Ahas01G0178300 [Arachis hypogaea]